MSTKSVLFSERFCQKANWLLRGRPLDFEYCVILIYRLKVSDRAGDVQVNFVFNISCVWGQCIFTIEKVLMGI